MSDRSDDEGTATLPDGKAHKVSQMQIFPAGQRPRGEGFLVSIIRFRRRKPLLYREEDLEGSQVPAIREENVPARTFRDTPSEPADLFMPQKSRRGFGGIAWFMLIVALPVAIAAYYYGWIASRQFVSEFRFAVTQSTGPALGTIPSTPPGGGAASAMTSMMGGMGVPTMASTQNYIVTDYLTSRQVVEDVEARINVSKRFDLARVDWLSRYDSSQSIESLTAYWQKMVTSSYDPITGLATARVRAFTPSDAKLIADTLVSLSEALVNKIDQRSKQDYVHFAENDVKRGEDRVKAARAALTDFRVAEGVIDPTVSIVAGNIQDTSSVRLSLLQLKTQIAAFERQGLGDAPNVRSLRAQATATQQELTRLEEQVGHKRGEDAKPLTNVMKRYEQLDLERQYAQTFLLNTLSELDQARTAAGQQSLYLTPYVRPSLPGKSVYPNPIASTLLVGLICFAIWLSLVLTFRAIGEYA